MENFNIYSDISKYIDKCRRSADDYISEVKSGNIITNEEIKLAVKRYENDLERNDLVFREDALERFFSFTYFLNINLHNKYQQFLPLPWQAYYYTNKYGFYWSENNKRRFQYSFLFMARKGGKSVNAVIENQYSFVGDGEIDPQCYLLATKREQAKVCLDYATGIINHSYPLNETVVPQSYRIVFKDQTRGGFTMTLPANPAKLDALNTSAVILDEVHALENHDLLNVMKSSTMSRENPMITIISTAGFSMSSLAFDLYTTGKKVLRNEIEDDSFLYMLYSLDDGDDYTEPINWYKSNPSLDHTVPLDKMKIEYNQAKIYPTQLKNFMTKNLNVFVDSVDNYFDKETLDNASRKLNIEDFVDCEGFGALDLSSTRDFTSFSLLFYKEGRFYLFVWYFWANNPDKRFRSGGIDIYPWIKEGYVKQCSTKTVDYDLIYDTVRKISEKITIKNIQYDDDNSALIIPRITNNLGLQCDVMGQNARKFNQPIKIMEKMLYDGKLTIDENPCTVWNFTNCEMPYVDGNGNIKFMKNKAKDSIDGAVASAMSFNGFIEYVTDNMQMGLDAYLDDESLLDEFYQ